MLSIIVAMTPERVIGRDGDLPWRLPADLRHFRDVTMGHPIIMGRKTFESIGKALDGRLSIVLTRDTHFEAAGCTVARSPDEALRYAVRTSNLAIDPKEIFIIGGASVYEAFLPRATRLYVTLVHAAIQGDTHFPEVDLGEWLQVSRDEHRADERNAHDYGFYVYERAATPAS